MKKATTDEKDICSSMDYTESLEKMAILANSIINATIALHFIFEPDTRPQLIGSGVLVNINHGYFVLTASHIREITGRYGLLIGLNKDEVLLDPDWKCLCAKPKENGDDPLDAAVYHILSEIPDSLKQRAITLDNINDENTLDTQIYFISGYPVNKSNTSHMNVSTTLVYLNCDECKDAYTTYSLDKHDFIAVKYPKRIMVNKSFMNTPIPRGMSGGAMIRVVYDTVNNCYRCVLKGIITTHKSEKGGNPGCIVGTHVGYYLNLISELLTK